MKVNSIVSIVLLCISGCTVSRLNLLHEPTQITIIQRQSKAIPGSRNTIKLHLDDITEGQVLISILTSNNRTILDTVSVKQGDVVPFEVGRHQYYLKVVRLQNFLIGDDFGVFEVASVSPGVTSP